MLVCVSLHDPPFSGGIESLHCALGAPEGAGEPPGRSCPTDAIDFHYRLLVFHLLLFHHPLLGTIWYPSEIVISFVQATIWSCLSFLALGVTSSTLPVFWVLSL